MSTNQQPQQHNDELNDSHIATPLPAEVEDAPQVTLHLEEEAKTAEVDTESEPVPIVNNKTKDHHSADEQTNSNGYDTITSPTGTDTRTKASETFSPMMSPTSTVALTTAQKSSAINVKVSEEIPSLDEYLNYIKMLFAQWKDAPHVSLCYENLTYTIPIAGEQHDIPNMGKAFLNLFKAITFQLPKKIPFYVYKECSGYIPAGRMTLLLAPPGSGKSQFLKTIGGHMRGNKQITGQVYYNGLTADEQEKEGYFVEKLCALVAQGDVHFANLTVRETFQFALDNSVVDPEFLENPTPELVAAHKRKVELLLSVLGMHECANTIAGNAMIRGISGGQKKRLTIGELMITNARILMLDEPTTGLDAAVARDIMVVLREWCQISNSTVIAALLQPTPECYELYDDLILMKEGLIVYQGPRSEISKFMWEQYGLEPDPLQDQADFLVDFLTDPEVVYQRQRRRWKKLGIAYSNSEEAASATTVMDLPSTAKRCVDNSHLMEAYTTSSYFAAQKAEIEKVKSQRETQTDLKKLHHDLSDYTREQFSRLYARSIPKHIWFAVKRQFKLLGRDKQTVPPRFFSAILVSVILGSLFLNTTDVYGKFGMLLFALLNSAMGNFTELPAAFEGRNTLWKQVDAGFYPTAAYVISVVVGSLPVMIVETVLFSIPLYFMVGLANDAGRFFFFMLVLLLVDVMIALFYRTFCFAVPTMENAQQLMQPAFSMLINFGGFLITRNKIPDFLIEFYWFSPISWAMRSLVQNEFQDDSYGGDGDRLLEIFEVQTEKIWKWMGIIYIVGFFFGCLFLASYFLVTIRFDLLQGTKRKKEELGISSEGSPTQTAASPQRQIEMQAVEQKQNQELNIPVINPKGSQLLNRNSTVGRSSGVITNVGSVLPFQPVSLAFRNVHYTVKVKAGRQTVDKKLLTDVSGYVLPGSLVALMGSSGAGKTTLMDVIAGRKTAGKIEGDILINGYPQDMEAFKRISGYVEQQDLHMPLATVRESLLFSARLRLPRSVTKEQREKFVDEILHLLELTPLADRIVGNTVYTGLSPGQLKLLTIGVELVANPAILFLDEPTSGLDSRAALVVMRVVKNIAATGRTVLCTIHQPSSEVFYLFDRLLLLRSGGRTVYFGDVGVEGADIVDYFQNKTPNTLNKPERMNPASWMLDVIGAGVAGALERSSGGGHFDYADHYDSSASFATEKKVLESISTADESQRVAVNVSDFGQTYSVMIWEVGSRIFTSNWRDTTTNFGRFMTLGFLGVLFGLLYLDIDDGDYAGVNSKIAAIFTSIAFTGMVHCNLAIPNIIMDRAVFYRERASDCYPSWIYSTGLALVDIPYMAVADLFFLIPFYFMVGLRNDAEVFFKYFLVMLVLSLVLTSFGQAAGALFPSFVVAVQCSGLLITFYFLFSGIFIRPESIPKGWLWLYYINPFPKGLIACSLIEFECNLPNPYDISSGCPTLTDENEDVVTTHAFINRIMDAGYSSYSLQIAYLLAFYAVFRLVVAASLQWVNHLKR